jgi:hypothetical protein
MIKPLPRDITSHDLLKAAAIIFMFIDHLGYYFYPEEVWFRVWGRFSAPVWFFLIGYADTRTVQLGIWLGALIVAATWAISGQYLFPINILFSLAFTRLMLNGIMARALKDGQSIWGFLLLLFFLALPSLVFMEYGTLGIMFAMAGFLVRHKNEIPLPQWNIPVFLGASALFLAGLQLLLLPPLTACQLTVLASGMTALCIVLYLFRPLTFPKLTRFSGPLAPVIRLLGRRTLEIYVLHLVVLAGIGMALQPDRFPLFEVKIMPPALARFFL